MHERNPAGIVDAVTTFFAIPVDRVAIRRYAEQFSWDKTTEGQLTLFHEILSKRPALPGATKALA
jgi:hypothetical protein